LRTWFYRNSARVLPSVLFLISRACACAMCERKFLCSGFLSGIQCYCICGGFSRIQCTCACAVDPNDTAHLCICGGSQETTVHLYHSISLRKIALRYFFFFFSQFSALPPTHMFFNLRPVANFGLVLPAVLKFSAFRLQWGVFIALMLFMLSKYPSFTPECEGGSIQEKNGDCILRMWNKGGKDVKEI